MNARQMWTGRGRRMMRSSRRVKTIGGGIRSLHARMRVLIPAVPQRKRALLKTTAAGGLALALAGACSAGSVAGGAQASPSTLWFSSPTAAAPSPSAQTCDPTKASPAPAASAAQGADVQRIEQKGYLTVGVAADQYLTGYLASDGQEEGFDIDLADAIAKSMFGDDYSKHLKFVAVSSDNRISDLNSGKVDLVIDTMTITCARMAQVDFSAVYYEASQRLLVESGSHINSLADLTNKSQVCAQAGSTSIQLIRQAPSKPSAYAVTDISDCLVLLQQNVVSAISTDDTILAGLAKQDPNLVIVGDALEPEPYGIAMPLGETDMQQYVNGVLAQYESSGAWEASYQNWFGKSLPAANPPVARYSS